MGETSLSFWEDSRFGRYSLRWVSLHIVWTLVNVLGHNASPTARINQPLFLNNAQEKAVRHWSAIKESFLNYRVLALIKEKKGFHQAFY